MSDVRALLKAKRQEVQVNHPLALYTSTGQLKCVACGGVVKHASAWEGHVGSKAHRMNVARLKEEERLREEREEKKQRGKRRAEDASERAAVDEVDLKRRRVADHEEDDLQEPTDKNRGFPSDFFSDSARALPGPLDGSDDEHVDDQYTGTGGANQSKSQLDAEWEIFQQTILKDVIAPVAADDDKRDAYERATVFAEPELAPETPAGFPPRDEEGPVESEEPSKQDEQEVRRRKEIDERELIIDRLLDEERAQEEADGKVAMLKARLEALKRKREAAKSGKAK